VSPRPCALALVSLILVISGCSTAAPTSSTTTASPTTTAPATIPNLQPFADATGNVSTYTTAGVIDESTSFFASLGTNGRTCATCHQAAQGMSMTPAANTTLFNSTNGTDPLFTAVDGANYPTAPTGDLASHSLILNNGLIRVAETLPAGTQFTITALSDPYNCAIVTDPTTGRPTISVYRRVLPSTSLIFLSNVMWDTRETIQPLTTASTFSTALTADLTQQLLDAISIHAQGTSTPTAAEQSSILALEQGLFTAQATDTAAGSLSANGATGGATALAGVNYYPGINDAFGGDPQGKPFNPNVFSLFTAWNNSTNAQQASIARGQGIFNNAPLQINAVSGLNSNNPVLGNPNTIQGSCSTCHDTPSIGNHSMPLVMDTGEADIAANVTGPGLVNGLAQLSQPTLPVFQITGCKNTNNQAVTYITSDPGKALLTGLCSDISRVKVPILRGLAARAPYFHNGSASSLTQVVNFYNARFGMNLNPQQKTDLVNFLSAL
jgi:cytochrome c peroxidase